MENRLKQPSREDKLLQEDIQEKIIEMVGKIEEVGLLDRIYRFVQYIYIHRT